MKAIFSFIRITENGSFEKVTWQKNKAGEKQSVKEPIIPSQEELIRLANSRYSETYIK